jgi:hypothetical protein
LFATARGVRLIFSAATCSSTHYSTNGAASNMYSNKPYFASKSFRRLNKSDLDDHKLKCLRHNILHVLLGMGLRSEIVDFDPPDQNSKGLRLVDFSLTDLGPAGRQCRQADSI